MSEGGPSGADIMLNAQRAGMSGGVQGGNMLLGILPNIEGSGLGGLPLEPGAPIKWDSKILITDSAIDSQSNKNGLRAIIGDVFKILNGNPTTSGDSVLTGDMMVTEAPVGDAPVSGVPIGTGGGENVSGSMIG